MNGFQVGCYLVAESLVVFGFEYALWFSAFDVEEDSGVIAAPSPSVGSCPVHVCLCDGRSGWGGLVKCEIPVFDEPLVDAEGAFHAFGAVV